VEHVSVADVVNVTLSHTIGDDGFAVGAVTEIVGAVITCEVVVESESEFFESVTATVTI
jgi:hypothetical protein